MKLQTKIPLENKSNNLIDYNSNILLLGSCFVENIGNKLDYFKFQNLQNPFGILFQPLAIEKLITYAINEKEFTEKEIFFHNEQWHCYDAHSKLSHASKEELLHGLNKQIDLTAKQLNSSSHIIITLGTAWVYRHIETDAIVANCHKVPQKKFLKELITVDEISESLQSIVELIRSVNKKASILFTVSPVRHLKDGFIENTQSKAHLIAAIHSIMSPRAQSRGLHYFPSYEIIMDELRDYRFYAEDMIHPNQTAINYVWEKFQGVWISKGATEIMDAVDYIQKGLQHKPFNSNSEAHQHFIQNLELKIKEIQSAHPKISF
ncbi:MAG: GSCFA domain-containing protein [Flavobacteriaceae bacterium]|nr:GSCFA domain-containing protein [Flavobacteriaceae bacterium]